MTTSPDRVPSLTKKAFVCPHCSAYAAQAWFKAFAADCVGDGLPSSQSAIVKTSRSPEWPNYSDYANRMFQASLPFFARETYSKQAVEVMNFALSKCHACAKTSIWVGERLVFPHAIPAVEANADMPADVVADFEEARQILQRSPRGAAALLRLCVQKLCKVLNEKGDDINLDIKNLVAKGLSPTIQKALDVVRVVGNESVHPGSLDMRDDAETAEALLKIVNVITEQMISAPKMIAELYAGLPQAKLDGIARRDSPKTA